MKRASVPAKPRRGTEVSSGSGCGSTSASGSTSGSGCGSTSASASARTSLIYFIPISSTAAIFTPSQHTRYVRVVAPARASIV